MSSRSSSWRTLLEVLLGAALTASAAAMVATFFSGTEQVAVLVAAAAAGSLVGALAGIRRVPVELGVLAGVVVLAVLGAWATFPSGQPGGVPGPAGLRSYGDALLHGWSRMLSVGVPAVATRELVALPLTVTALAGFVTALLVRRTRTSLLPVAPALLLLVGGLLLLAVQPGARLDLTAAFLGVAVLLVFVRVGRPAAGAEAASRTGGPGLSTPVPGTTAADLATQEGAGSARRRRGLGRAAVGLPVLAVVSALAVLLGSALPVSATRDRFDPRSLRAETPEVFDVPSPLLGIKSQLDRDEPTDLFRVRFSSTQAKTIAPQFVRLATLSDFDGVTWRNDGLFAPPGARLDAQGTLLRPVRLTVSVDVSGLPGPWLPVLGRPARVRASEVAYSAPTATLVSRRGSVQGLHYEVDTDIAVTDATGMPEALAQALPDTSGVAADAVGLPAGMPEELTRLAEDVTAEQAAPYAKLQALQAYLRRAPYGLKDVAPGHSYAVLRRTFLSDDEVLSASFAEQHAAAFAVMARSLGFPARVAVGYRLTDAARAADGSYTVTTAAAHAWPEVSLAGFGWYAFEPTDVRNVATTKRNPEQPKVESTGGGAPPEEGEVSVELDPAGLPGAPVSVTERLTFWSILLGCVLLALAVLVWLAKAVRRRRRRRAGRPSQRVLGAWRESVDRLVEAGLGPPDSMTPEEVAGTLEAGAGNRVATPVFELAPILARAVYAPDEPQASDVAAAWRCERALRRALDARVVFPLRWRRRFDPRPLVRRGRSARPEPTAPSRRRRRGRARTAT